MNSDKQIFIMICKSAGAEPMAQRQRVGFQTRRLGVQIPLGSLVIFWFCPYAQNAHNTHPRRVPLYAVFIDPKVTYLAGA